MDPAILAAINARKDAVDAVSAQECELLGALTRLRRARVSQG
jgi:hypothetical protein